MFKSIYKAYSNTFRLIIPPDGEAPAYYLNGKIWSQAFFTQLGGTVIILSLLSAIFFHLYLNGSNMPAVYNNRKTYITTLSVNAVINFFGVLILFSMNTLKLNNHFFCTATASALYSTIVFLMISLVTKFWSTSAKKIPI